MIHQCFFAEDQRAGLFTTEPYQPFGLEPEVNDELTENCPELASADLRMAIAEYGAMLHLWRNPGRDPDSWIGFTSYRQLAKTTVGFASKRDVETLLAGGDFVTWYMWWLGDQQFGSLRYAAAQAEQNHPGLHGFIVDMLRDVGETVPRGYTEIAFAPFANYWVLRKPQFNAFMAWSWPIVERALRASHPYLSPTSSIGERDNKRRAVGYFIERLFILYVHRTGLKPVVVGPVFSALGVPLSDAEWRAIRSGQSVPR